MPDNGFRNSRRFRFSTGPAGDGAGGRFARRIPSALPDEGRADGIRWELVARAREKIAMGIYDHPAVLERALDLMAGDTAG